MIPCPTDMPMTKAKITMSGSRVAIAQKIGNERPIAATHPKRYTIRRPMRSERCPNRGIVISSTAAPNAMAPSTRLRESPRLVTA